MVFPPPLLKRFRSYLADRSQRVVLEGVYSDWLPVTSGAPQGSILGPLLFLVFVNNMPDYVCSDSKLALFADDSNYIEHWSHQDRSLYFSKI